MIYFISGHRDLTIEEFKKHYIPKIDEVCAFDKNAKFVVGDYLHRIIQLIQVMVIM